MRRTPCLLVRVSPLAPSSPHSVAIYAVKISAALGRNALRRFSAVALRTASGSVDDMLYYVPDSALQARQSARFLVPARAQCAMRHTWEGIRKDFGLNACTWRCALTM